MKEFIKIENNPDLVKDIETGAIISNDSAAFQDYIDRRNKNEKDAERLNTLESELSDVKMLLNEILRRL